ncbi:histidine phosphatase family protein [Thiohalobacter sp.]|uniref:histidine phosphatase family protein n=1 Tax=Thiohalobacter sp. TaxID=2025948 RepID=UPI00262D3163|nr:histidine phosphatase family protein [Thiohalobacter sp.]
MQLYLMRHGHSEYNALGLCNDDPGVPVHLTRKGRAQAEAAAARLREVPLEAMIASELPRTRETAEIVNRFHGVPIHVHPALNDIRTGFDGRPVAEYFAATRPDRLRIRPPGGESVLDYRERVLGFVDWLAQQPWQVLLVVAHEETLRILNAHFTGLPEDRLLDQDFANCEILRFRLEP